MTNATGTKDANAVSLLWLSGTALRLTILAVPPVLVLMQADLQMSGTEIGILTGLPVVLFALAAIPGSLLIARFGALHTLIIGTLLTAIGGALRGVVPDVMTLYLATIVMSAGVAVMQPALPPLVREWLPRRIGFGGAVFVNGLLVGEILPVALTATLFLPLLGGSWRLALSIWSLPVIAIAVALILFSPKQGHASTPAAGVAASLVKARWWPDWSDALMWRLGLVVGAANCVYFGTNAFIPAYLASAGRADLISAVLTALNVVQIPASFLLLALASRVERRAWPFMLGGMLMLAGVAGVVFTAGVWTVFFAAAIGFAAAGILAMGLALPALLYTSADVGRVSAAMFVIGYTLGVLLSVLGGAAWDLTGDSRFAFLPVALGALPALLLPGTIDFHRGER